MNKKQRTAQNKKMKEQREEISRLHHGKTCNGYNTDIPVEQYTKKKGNQSVVQRQYNRCRETGKKVLTYERNKRKEEEEEEISVEAFAILQNVYKYDINNTYNLVSIQNNYKIKVNTSIKIWATYGIMW